MLRYAVLRGWFYFADSGSRLLKSLQLRLVAQNLVFVELQKFNLGLVKIWKVGSGSSFKKLVPHDWCYDPDLFLTGFG